MYLITNSANLIVEICEHPCYVRKQANGVVVLSEPDKADAIYSNDSNTFWPTQQVGYLCDRHTLVEVESVPAEVVAGFYFYHAGEFYTTEANLTALAKARAPELASLVFVKMAETEHCLCESDNRWCCSCTFCIGDNYRFTTFHNCYT